MNNKFDELAKGLARSVTRRQALKKFGLGLAGIALACFGLANKAGAVPECFNYGHVCTAGAQCCNGFCNNGACGCTSDFECSRGKPYCVAGVCAKSTVI